MPDDSNRRPDPLGYRCVSEHGDCRASPSGRPGPRLGSRSSARHGTLRAGGVGDRALQRVHPGRARLWSGGVSHLGRAHREHRPRRDSRTVAVSGESMIEQLLAFMVTAVLRQSPPQPSSRARRSSTERGHRRGPPASVSRGIASSPSARSRRARGISSSTRRTWYWRRDSSTYTTTRRAGCSGNRPPPRRWRRASRHWW